MNEFNSIRVAKANYTYGTTNDGSQTTGLGLGVNIPQGAVVLEVITRENTAFTSSGSATVAINIGGTEVLSAAAYDTGFDGVDSQYSTAAEISGEVNIDIETADLTAGDVDIFVKYIV